MLRCALKKLNAVRSATRIVVNGASTKANVGCLRPTPMLRQNKSCFNFLDNPRQAECPKDLLLNQSPAVNAVLGRLVPQATAPSRAVLYGLPRSGKSWLIPAIETAAKSSTKTSWSEVFVVQPDGFAELAKKLKAAAAATPLVIVDNADELHKDFLRELPDSVALLLIADCTSNNNNNKVVLFDLPFKSLWLAAPSVDKSDVRKWIGNVLESATEIDATQKQRLIDNTFNVCGGHVGRMATFLKAVVDGQSSLTSLPFRALEGDSSVAMLQKNSGFAGTAPGQVGQANLCPVGVWKADEEAVFSVERISNTSWSLSSGAQRDHWNRSVAVQQTFEDFHVDSPLQLFLSVLPFWRTDLLFVWSEHLQEIPFMERHVNQAFAEAVAAMRFLRPRAQINVVHGFSTLRAASKHGVLDFLIEGNNGQRFGIDFVVKSNLIKSHHYRYRPRGPDAALNLAKHMVVYFEADPNHSQQAKDVVRSTRCTCCVTPCPVHGWDAFHVLYNEGSSINKVVVPRIGGLQKLFKPECVGQVEIPRKADDGTKKKKKRKRGKNTPEPYMSLSPESEMRCGLF